MYLSTHRPCSVLMRGQTLHGWVVVYHKDQYYSVSCRALFSSKAVHKTIWLSNLPVEGGSCEGIIWEHGSPTARKREEITNDKNASKYRSSRPWGAFLAKVLLFIQLQTWLKSTLGWKRGAQQTQTSSSCIAITLTNWTVIYWIF